MFLWQPLSFVSIISLLLGHSGDHNVQVQNDGRALIGPVGAPFGFLPGGVFEIEVNDFELTPAGRFNSLSGSNRSDNIIEVDHDDDDESLRGLQAGFFLQRFQNERSFRQYMQDLASNTSRCAFEYYQQKDNDESDVSHDIIPLPLPYEDDFAGFTDIDDEFADVGEYQRAENGLLVELSNSSKHFKYVFDYGEEGLYFLLYQVCRSFPAANDNNNYQDNMKVSSSAAAKVQSTFSLQLRYRNYSLLGHVSYLSAGKVNLPFLYFMFALGYAICTSLWLKKIKKQQQLAINNDRDPNNDNNNEKLPLVYPIHKFMGLLLATRTLATFIECLRYRSDEKHFNQVSWIYYLEAYMNGAFLLTIFLLIGCGWGSDDNNVMQMKPVWKKQERTIVFVALILQIANQTILKQMETEQEQHTFDDTAAAAAFFHIIDIICCCTVLVLTTRQVDNLRETIVRYKEGYYMYELVDNSGDGLNNNNRTNNNFSHEDEEGEDKTSYKTIIMEQLTLFRSFYTMAVVTMYLNRILVYQFAPLLDYKHLWVKDFVIEAITLAFYVIAFYKLHPKGTTTTPSPSSESELTMVAS